MNSNTSVLKDSADEFIKDLRNCIRLNEMGFACDFHLRQGKGLSVIIYFHEISETTNVRLVFRQTSYLGNKTYDPVWISVKRGDDFIGNLAHGIFKSINSHQEVRKYLFY